MASKPKSALASLLDNINNSEQEVAVVEAGVAIPAVEELVEDSEGQGVIFSTYDTKKRESNTPELINIDPMDCHLWLYTDRPDGELGDIQSLAKSMKNNGQQEPILVRPNTQKTKHKYEVIFGNRRWRAASSEGILLQAIVKSVTDQQAALFQKEENENRKDLSDYARAQSYKKQIASGVFQSETELSKALHISKRTLNDIMAYVRVPKHIIDAIPNYAGISRATAIKLSVLGKDKSLHNKLLKLGPHIGGGTITAANVDFELNREYLSRPKHEVRNIVNLQGEKVGKLKKHPTGTISIIIDGKFSEQIDINSFCKQISEQCTNKEK